MALKKDIYIDHGSSFSEEIQIVDAPIAPATQGLPQNLTGNTFRGKIKKTLADANSVAVFTCVLNNANSGFIYSLTSIQSAAIPIKPQRVQDRALEPFVYDIERVYPNGTVERVLEGVAYISPRATT